MTTTAARYGSMAIALHWLMFVLVSIVAVLGLLHDDWAQDTQAYWINLHAVLGLLVWALLLFRFGWRLNHPPPPLPAAITARVRQLSTWVHRALYALIFVIPLIGIVTFVWHGRVFDFGAFQVDFKVAKNRAIFHPTEDLHGYLAYGLFGLAGLHALVALWHHFIRHDGVLGRMWPKGR